ncbi:MAG: hypothetical protein NTY19_18920 [Planctomycetota bacterium]|nr:hypothetical protein [Planctomycetota bacterium]
MRTWVRTCAAATVLLAGLTVVGCGAAKKPFPTAILAGTVKLNGQPVTNGTISFVPSDGKVPTAGAIIQAGKYSVEVPLGPKKILISAVQGTGRMQKAYDTPDSPATEITEEIVPACYNSATTLAHDVTANKADLNFDLKK